MVRKDKEKKSKANVKEGKVNHPEEIPEYFDGEEIQEGGQKKSQEEKKPTEKTNEPQPEDEPPQRLMKKWRDPFPT